MRRFQALASLEIILPDSPLYISADATQIEQVLLNLCTNAIQALPEQTGHIFVELQSVQLLDGDHRLAIGLTPGHFARLTVSDNGSGMEQESLGRIFEPFYTTKGIGISTGMGLAIVYGIIKSHHGEIYVQSELGKCTTFEVLIPLVDKPVSAMPQPPPVNTIYNGSGKHIFYVDDDEAMVFLVTRMLKEHGCRVSGFDSASEALESICQNLHDVDLVVTDFNMPKASGLDLARGIARIRADLPKVIVTGFVTEDLLAKARDIGIRRVILKPDTILQLYEIVQEQFSYSASLTQ